MTRMVLLTFFGDYRGHAHPHESPRSMTAPLVVLAVATCVVGLLGSAVGARSCDWVFFGAAARGRRSLRLAADLARRWRSRHRRRLRRVPAVARSRPDRAARRPSTRARAQVLHRRLLHERASSGRSATRWSAGVYWFNQHMLDGIVNGGGDAGPRARGAWSTWFDRNVIDGVVNGAGERDGASAAPAHAPERQRPAVRGRRCSPA